MNLPVKIWQEIVIRCDPLSQILFRKVCKIAYQQLPVTDLYHLPSRLKKRLNNKVLRKYPYVVELNAFNNSRITNVSYMRLLKKLNATGYCGICDAGLDLDELNAHNNSKITDVSHVWSLKKLVARGYYCEIGDADIASLDLMELGASYNGKITNVSPMKSLKN